MPAAHFWLSEWRMRLSCRLEVLPGKSVVEQVANARRYGFDGVGLPGRHLKHYLEELEAALPDLPIPPMSLSLGFQGSLLHPEERERRRCRDSLRSLMDVCARIGVSLLNAPPALIQDHPILIAEAGGFSSVEARQDALLLEQLGGLGGEAKARGMLFLLEPVNHFESDYLNSVEHGSRLCERVGSEAVGMTIDAYHMQMEEKSYERAILHAGRHVRHVHVAENTRAEPGSGLLDFAAVFRGLKGIRYQGWIEVECRKLSGPGEEVLPRSVQYLRETWSQA